MCGIAGIAGGGDRATIEAMDACQRHRGPDAHGVYNDPAGKAWLGHRRLSIIDLSEAGTQPLASHDGRFHIALNGEIYNYIELREELDYPFRTRTDTEVALAAFARWGPGCLDRFIGMFAMLIWDEQEQTMFAARDRFGVKPLYLARGPGGSVMFASEIKALHAAGFARTPDEITWATYLARAVAPIERTFWLGIEPLAAGTWMRWNAGTVEQVRWYDLAERTKETDSRPADEVRDEYRSLLEDSVQLRFRADVPIGINLSGGLDSSVLVALVRETQGEDSDVRAFTFTTGDERYDETPWVREMLERTKHPLEECRLNAGDVPALAAAMFEYQDEPYGGIPTLAYARVFERAHAAGVTVLLDGQGMDEQWAGYDYYGSPGSAVVQGTTSSPARAECLTPAFAGLAEHAVDERPFNDRVRDLQYRDTTRTKLPRALRYNDRVSMRSSTELREPFLDHRLFELAVRQTVERKINGGVTKWLLRRVAEDLVPAGLHTAPKRSVQTPQREWLRGELSDWAWDRTQEALDTFGAWLDRDKVVQEWRAFLAGDGDNSFFVWQWIDLGITAASLARSG